MGSIHGLAYIIIGIAMSVTSKIINAKTDSNSLTLFFYLGIIAAIFGVMKLLFKAIFQNKTKPKNKNDPDFTDPLRHKRNPFNPTAQIRKTDYTQGNHHINKTQKQDFVQHPSIVSCPACGTRHYDYAHFCMKCGGRLK